MNKFSDLDSYFRRRVVYCACRSGARNAPVSKSVKCKTLLTNTYTVCTYERLTYDRGRNAVGTSQRDHNDDTQTTDTNGRELAGYWVSDVAHAGNSML